ncbi:unnamed protein product [Ophioblennius macclurei]
MVILRRGSGGGGGAEPEAATPRRRPVELDSSSEFLSLVPASHTRSGRLTRSCRAGDDSFSSPEHNTANGHADMKPEGSGLSLRTRGRRVKLAISFSDVEPKTSSPVGEHKAECCCTRKSSRLQKDLKASDDVADVPDEVEGSSTPKRSRFNLRSRDVDEEELEEEEDHGSVRRSSRITRYKLDSRKQSVLYDRLITNTAEAVLQKMDDMRRRLRSRDRGEATEELGLYTTGKMRRSLRFKMKRKKIEEENKGINKDDTDEEDDEEDDEEEEEEEEDEDADDGENQRRYDFRKRKTVVRYQESREEPKQTGKSSIFHSSSPARRRFRFGSAAAWSPYGSRRSSRRRHAIHSSDSTSSSSDEEQFQRRRSKNRTRPVNRCLPMNMVKEDLLGIHKDRMKIGANLADVDPMRVDKTVRFDGIGGLSRHISALKEMVVFPLLYPEVFERFRIQPPRGCLFYGPPGTGKTLVARALANECSQGERKVSFFMRKGADCLSKWIGESERRLRLLFDQAYQMRPAIIFFDEIDGLAPVRSSRQDQSHSSIVSTLLALMDGLDNRGEIVVIGATNRLDSIDPALRRPGRFDREFLFGLPDREARKDILKIHTRQWTPKPSDIFLDALADKCVGYCGADIKAVCSEAALCALRRRYPQIYSSSQKLELDVNSINISNKDFMLAMSKMVPAAQRAVVSPAKALIPAIRPLLGTTLQNILCTVSRVFPHAEQGLKRKREQGAAGGALEDDPMYSEEDDTEICSNRQRALSQLKPPTSSNLLNFSRSVLSEPTSYRPRLLLEGRPGSGQSAHLAPAVLHALEKFTVYTLDMAVLFGASATTPEETCARIFVEAKRTAPSILYVPHIGQWWETVGSALRATFTSLLSSIPAFSPILLLATCNLCYDQLSMEVQELFRIEYGEVFCVEVPTRKERRDFFEDLILHQAAKAPSSRKKAVLHSLEVLPVAPSLPPRQLTREEIKRLEEQEEATLRELRLFLRDVTNRLSQDKRFKSFTKPVELEEAPDYTKVIRTPMDLSTILTRVDLHKYGTVKEYLEDVNLIWKNVLEFNQDKGPSDRQIRHKACALKDAVHAIIKDELNEDFERICEEIKESRKARGCSTSQFAPSFYHVLPKQSKPPAVAKPSKVTTQKKAQPAAAAAAATPNKSASSATTTKTSVTPQKKKRRINRWSKGFCTPRRRSSNVSKDVVQLDSDKDEDETQKGAGSGAGQASQYMKHTEKRQQPAVQDIRETGKTESNDSQTQRQKETSENTNKDNPTERGGKGVEKTELSWQTEVAETSTRRDQNSSAERDARRMTRAMKSAALQQRMINVEQALMMLDQESSQLVVDKNKLQELLERVVVKTEGYEVYKLEKLYALLCQSIYRHRRHYNKTVLIQELEQEIEGF